MQAFSRNLTEQHQFTVLYGEHSVLWGELNARLGHHYLMLMKRTAFTLILIIVLLFSALVVIQFTNSVAAHTYSFITIKPDGIIEGTDKIQRNGNVYTLTDDIINSTITVTCNDVVLDGSGFTLRGPTGWVSGIGAINLTCSNVTVENFNIIGFWEAGILGAYNENNIINNNITETDRALAIYANGYCIKSNYLADNHIGIRIVGRNNNITQNHIVDNYVGFRITNSSKNNITTNIIEKNVQAIVTDYGGFQVYHNNFINQTIGSGGGWEAMILSTNYFYLGVNVTSKPEWDNGYPSGGNYWSDYAIKYPNATEIGNSGIGDTAYFIGISCAINSTYANTYIVEAVDRYPLMIPFIVSEPVIPISSPIPSPSPEPQLTPFPFITIIGLTLVVAVIGASLGFLTYLVKRKSAWKCLLFKVLLFSKLKLIPRNFVFFGAFSTVCDHLVYNIKNGLPPVSLSLGIAFIVVLKSLAVHG